MDDFRIRTSWRSHRKRKQLRKRLGADGILAIQDLWSYASQERTDGDLYGMSSQDIADEVDYPGDAEKLVAVLVELRLIDGEPGSFVIHDWAENQPFVSSSEARSEAAKAAAKVRWSKEKLRKENKLTCDSHATRMRPVCDPHADVMPQPTNQPTNQPERDRGPLEGAAEKLGFGRLLSSSEQKRLLELKPTADEVDRAVEETRDKAARPNAAYALSVIESGRRQPASGKARDPTQGGRIGYHPGSKPEEFVEGQLDLNTL